MFDTVICDHKEYDVECEGPVLQMAGAMAEGGQSLDAIAAFCKEAAQNMGEWPWISVP